MCGKIQFTKGILAEQLMEVSAVVRPEAWFPIQNEEYPQYVSVFNEYC